MKTGDFFLLIKGQIFLELIGWIEFVVKRPRKFFYLFLKYSNKSIIYSFEIKRIVVTNWVL